MKNGGCGIKSEYMKGEGLSVKNQWLCVFGQDPFDFEGHHGIVGIIYSVHTFS